MTDPALDRKKAVALEYDGEHAPVVTAKGEGVIAEKIIEMAKENGIHIDENPLLVEALGDVSLQDEIPVELYKAVAEIIGFVLSQQAKG